MALSFTAECLGIDSENYLFSKLNKKYKATFKNMISRRQYNDLRKLLFERSERAQSGLTSYAKVFAIDSIPIQIGKLSREKRTKMGKESIHKLHSVCTAAGVIESLDLTNASVHDVHYLKDVKELFSNCIITGDKGISKGSIK